MTSMLSARLDSSALLRIDYDPRHRWLEATFRSGARYRYHGVQPIEVKRLLEAASAGTHFNRHIKPAHRFERLDGWRDTAGRPR